MNRRLGVILLFLGAGAILLGVFSFATVQLSPASTGYDIRNYLVLTPFILGLALVIAGMALRFSRRGTINTRPAEGWKDSSFGEGRSADERKS